MHTLGGMAEFSFPAHSLLLAAALLCASQGLSQFSCPTTPPPPPRGTPSHSGTFMIISSPYPALACWRATRTPPMGALKRDLAGGFRPLLVGSELKYSHPTSYRKQAFGNSLCCFSSQPPMGSLILTSVLPPEIKNSNGTIFSLKGLPFLVFI